MVVDHYSSAVRARGDFLYRLKTILIIGAYYSALFLYYHEDISNGILCSNHTGQTLQYHHNQPPARPKHGLE